MTLKRWLIISQLFWGSLATSGNHPKTYDVVVVGAGLSGLQAAVDVQAAGLSVAVLEAIDRVGGKTLSVNSYRQDKGTREGVNDLGAAWINDSNQSEIVKLFKKAGGKSERQRAEGVTIRQQENGTVIKFPYGPPAVNEEEGRLLTQLLSGIRNTTEEANLENPILGPDARRLDSITFLQYCLDISQDTSTYTKHIANYLTRALLGVEADDISALYTINYFKAGTGIDNLISDGPDGGQYLRSHRGTQIMARYLASQLSGRSLFLSTVVKSIDQSRHGGRYIEVISTSGEIFKAERVIVSVPTTLYPTIAFMPALPAPKALLAENTAMGTYGKMFFVFDRPWWREAGLSGIFESFVGPVEFTRDNSVPADNQWSIACFLVGGPGRELSKYSKAKRQELVWAQFKKVFESAVEKVPEPVNVIEREWKRAQYFDGAPSPVMGVGVLTALGDAEELRRPFGRVHFVGTETSVVWKGYMEGAVRSGHRGAAEVVAALR